MSMKRNWRVLAGAALLASALPVLGFAADSKGLMEADVSRWGSDYRRFVIDKGGADACLAACASDAKCQAWSYVKPGMSGSASAVCRLKEGVPRAAADPCCVSGVKAAMAGTMGSAAPAEKTAMAAPVKTEASGVTGSIKKKKKATTTTAKPVSDVLQMPMEAETPEALTSIGASLDLPDPTGD